MISATAIIFITIRRSPQQVVATDASVNGCGSNTSLTRTSKAAARRASIGEAFTQSKGHQFLNNNLLREVLGRQLTKIELAPAPPGYCLLSTT